MRSFNKSVHCRSTFEYIYPKSEWYRLAMCAINIFNQTENKTREFKCDIKRVIKKTHSVWTWREKKWMEKNWVNWWRSVDPVWSSSECNHGYWQVTMHDYDGPHKCPHPIFDMFFCSALFSSMKDWTHLNVETHAKRTYCHQRREKWYFHCIQLVLNGMRSTIIPCNPFVTDQRISIVYLAQTKKHSINFRSSIYFPTRCNWEGFYTGVWAHEWVLRKKFQRVFKYSNSKYFFLWVLEI